MKVLIACEFSGIVRQAFRRRGHDAWSVDLKQSEMPNNHYIDDVSAPLRSEKWDMLIAFPPCTHLCSAGAMYWPEKQEDGRQKRAVDFVMFLHDQPHIPKIAIENPVGILSSLWRKPDQIINPYQFGDPYMKKTCLWLKNLPLLVPTMIVEPIAHWHGGVRRGGAKANGDRTPSKLKTALKYGEEERSRTFQGIADAMATQWPI